MQLRHSSFFVHLSPNKETKFFWVKCGTGFPLIEDLEALLEDGINAFGLGPQGMGGRCSVMGVNIENTARHPSTIGVAANVGCWSHRRGHVVFDKDLYAVCDIHSTVDLNA